MRPSRRWPSDAFDAYHHRHESEPDGRIAKLQHRVRLLSITFLGEPAMLTAGISESAHCMRLRYVTGGSRAVQPVNLCLHVDIAEAHGRVSVSKPDAGGPCRATCGIQQPALTAGSSYPPAVNTQETFACKSCLHLVC